MPLGSQTYRKVASGAHGLGRGQAETAQIISETISAEIADREKANKSPAWLERLARTGTDLLSMLVALVLAGIAAHVINEVFFDRTFQGLSYSNITWRIFEFSILNLLLISFFASRGHYSSRHPFWTEARDIAMGVLVFSMADGFLQFALKEQPSRLWLGLTWAIAIVLLPLGRLLVRQALRRFGRWNIRTLMLGEGPTAHAACAALESEPYIGFEVIKQIDFSSLSSNPGDGNDSSALTEVGGSVGHAISNHATQSNASFIVLAPNAAEFGKLEHIIHHLERWRLPYAVVPPVQGISLLSLEPQRFYSHDVMMLTFRTSLATPTARFLKRCFDLLVASLLSLLLAPFFVAMVYAIRRDGGSAFFWQSRIGKNGKPFACYKFRTMMMDADEKLQELLQNDPVAAEEWARDQKLRDDPRVTRIGTFLRNTSLDELPQLFNVLRGEMSLVGPRPIVEDEIARYGDNIHYYLNSLPGVTGLWQVSGRNDTTYRRRVELDRWYTQNWSLWQDIAILCKTLPAVFARRGAY